jgi:hypothetical protein
MLPNPINAFGCLIAEIAAVELTAEEKEELNGVSKFGLQMLHLVGFLFASLVHVCEIASFRSWRFSCAFLIIGLDSDPQSRSATMVDAR